MIKNKIPYQVVPKCALDFTQFGCSAAAYILYFQLATISSAKLSTNPEIEISIKEFQRRTGFCEEKVRQGLVELEKAGWIDIIRRGVQKVNQYRVYEFPVDRL